MMGRKFENNKLKMAKTAAAYTKKASLIGKKIKIAVRAGGADPESNRQLGLIMKEAQALNVKRDIVLRNIKAASEKSDGPDFKELTYEMYGYGGVGFIINALSDNNNRAFTLIGTAVKKSGLNLAEQGSVINKGFETKGRITINSEIDEDTAIDIALEADVSDVEGPFDPDTGMRQDGEDVKSVLLVGPTELGAMVAALQAAGFDCVGNRVHEPIEGTLVECNEEDLEKNLAALDRLEEVDDVDSVEHNIHFSTGD